MKRLFLPTVFGTLILLFISNIGNAQTKKNAFNSKATTAIQVIQFHSEHRCMTCNKIEELTKFALKKHPTIPFSLVNADDKKNEKKCTQFQAYGSSLFLYNTKPKKLKILPKWLL